MSKKQKYVPILYLATFLCIILGLVFLYAYCKKESSTLQEYEFAADGVETAQDGLSLSVTVSKAWHDRELHPQVPIGAQYDGVLVNHSDYQFRDWSVEMEYGDDMTIDSSWNGEFLADGRTITFTAQGDTAVVDAGAEATFGSVMYAKSIMRVRKFRLTGYRVVKMTELTAFKVLMTALMFWLIILAMNFSVHIQVRRYKEKQKVDKEIIKESMNTFIEFIDAKDTYTKGHSSRVAEYACEIARRMKKDQDYIEKLEYITLMHDCGKIGVPDSILKKPGRLNAEEYREIQQHTVIGGHILTNFTEIPGIQDGAHYHHEKYDGTGYPEGLKGEEIPFCARIICVADAYDAMSTNRCYRKHLEKEEIIAELKRNTGTQFDPLIVKYMLDMIEDGFTDQVLKKYAVFDG